MIYNRKLDTLKGDSPATTETRNLWIVPLMGLLGYVRVRLLRRKSRPAPAEVHARLSHWLARCPTARPIDH